MSFFENEVEHATERRLTTSAVGIAEVTHESVRDQLSDYMANSLPEGERARVSEHLLRCADCRAYRATIRATSDALSRLPVEKAPAPSKRRLREIPDGLGHEE